MVTIGVTIVILVLLGCGMSHRHCPFQSFHPPPKTNGVFQIHNKSTRTKMEEVRNVTPPPPPDNHMCLSGVTLQVYSIVYFRFRFLSTTLLRQRHLDYKMGSGLRSPDLVPDHHDHDKLPTYRSPNIIIITPTTTTSLRLGLDTIFNCFYNPRNMDDISIHSYI